MSEQLGDETAEAVNEGAYDRAEEALVQFFGEEAADASHPEYGEVGAEGAEGEGAEEQGQEQEQEPAEEQGEGDKEESTSKALRRIQKQRAELKQKEESIRQAESQLQEKHQHIQQLEQRVSQFEQARNAATADPVGFLQSIGLDASQLKEVAEDAYAEALGDDAPPSLKQKRAQRKSQAQSERTRKETEERLQEHEQKRKQEQLQQYIAAWEGEAKNTAASLDQGEFPYLSRYQDQGAIAQALKNAAVEYARQNPSAGRDLHPKEAAQVVEQRLAQLAKIYQQPKQGAQQDKSKEEKPQAGAGAARKPRLSNATASRRSPSGEEELEEDDKYRARALAALDKHLPAAG